jgi:hypothetical protein
MKQDWTSFTSSIAVKSDLETIYNAWTKSSEIEKWFLENCHYQSIERNRRVIVECEYEWTWYLYEVMEKVKSRLVHISSIKKCLLEFPHLNWRESSDLCPSYR